MKKWLIIVAISFSLLGIFGERAEAILINFDDVASGTAIDTYYSGLGVTFSCSACTSSTIYAVASTVNNSPPNVISTQSTFPANNNQLYGDIKATFSIPVNTVSIDVWPTSLLGTNAPIVQLHAYDSGNDPIGTANSSTFETWETLTVTGNISYIILTEWHTVSSQEYYIADNLSYTRAQVPEPSTILLFGNGLLGLGYFGRKIRGKR